MKKILTLLLIISSTALLAQTKKDTYSNDFPAYVIYNNEGERVTYSQMVNSVIEADVMLFGELHNDPISHWLELSLLKSFHSIKGDKLIVGAEMWESDN
ncbi:MAG: ChaN family lipoprotein, partial [Bacteroidales bacterium]|nr:ChaN family lipoprotein [Bacteroidales bacterium]